MEIPNPNTTNTSPMHDPLTQESRNKEICRFPKTTTTSESEKPRTQNPEALEARSEASECERKAFLNSQLGIIAQIKQLL